MKALSHKELAQMYGVTSKTLSHWLQPFREKIKIKGKQKIYTPLQVKIIFECLGEP